MVRDLVDDLVDDAVRLGLAKLLTAFRTDIGSRENQRIAVTPRRSVTPNGHYGTGSYEMIPNLSAGTPGA